MSEAFHSISNFEPNRKPLAMRDHSDLSERRYYDPQAMRRYRAQERYANLILKDRLNIVGEAVEWGNHNGHSENGNGTNNHTNGTINLLEGSKTVVVFSPEKQSLHANAEGEMPCLCPDHMKDADICFTKAVIEGLNKAIVYDEQTDRAVIRASLDPKYNDPFGRDTFITANYIREAANLMPDSPQIAQLYQKTKKAVIQFWHWQSPNGKLPHEIRPYDRQVLEETHFYYPEGDKMVNRDSVDSTPLGLIETAEYLDESDPEYKKLLPKIVKALHWLTFNMDENKGWLSYRYNPRGLTQQGWMDSHHSVKYPDGSLAQDPIALVEAQAFAWKAFRIWSDRLQDEIPQMSADLRKRADELKERFNREFRMEDDKGVYFAHALDGNGQQVKSVSINPALALWASYNGESIINDKDIPGVVKRLMDEGMFNPECGVKLFEDGQTFHDPEGYHNGEGVYWQFASGLDALGKIKMGYAREGEQVLEATRNPYMHYKSFVEQFSKNGTYKNNYHLFREGSSEGACMNQTWSMAEFLWDIAYSNRSQEKIAA